MTPASTAPRRSTSTRIAALGGERHPREAEPANAGLFSCTLVHGRLSPLYEVQLSCALHVVSTSLSDDTLSTLMPQNTRDYLYAALLIATPVLLLAGAVVFWAAVSFEGHIAALMLLALASCSFAGARELKPLETRAYLQALGDY